MKRVMPAWRSSGSVLQTRTMKSARGPLVMKVLEPLMTYSSPSRIAVVRMPATSEPTPGSVIPRLPIFSPLRPGSRYLRFCSSLPSRSDRGQDHVALHGEAHVGAAGAGVAHALGADQRVEVVAALAAVLLREAEAEEAELAGALHRRGRPVGVLPLVAVRPQLLADPGLHRLAQVFVLLAEDEVLAPGLVVGLDDVGAVGRRGRHCLSPRSFLRDGNRPKAEWTVALLTFNMGAPRSAIYSGRMRVRVSIGLVLALLAPALLATAAEAKPSCDGKTATIVGGEGNNHLVGSKRPDVIYAGGGDDTIKGEGGNDTICAGDGDDRVSAGSGSDRIFGEGGVDNIDGDSGNEFIAGGAGNDYLDENYGDGTVLGGPGNDALIGYIGIDTLKGGAGEDSLAGGIGFDTLSAAPATTRSNPKRATTASTAGPVAIPPLCERTGRGDRRPQRSQVAGLRRPGQPDLDREPARLPVRRQAPRRLRAKPSRRRPRQGQAGRPRRQRHACAVSRTPHFPFRLSCRRWLTSWSSTRSPTVSPR